MKLFFISHNLSRPVSDAILRQLVLLLRDVELAATSVLCKDTIWFEFVQFYWSISSKRVKFSFTLNPVVILII